MTKLGRIALVLAVVAMASSPALAQQRQRGQRGGFGGSTIVLLTQKSVQDELKLSGEQVQKIKELSDKQRESFRGPRDEDARKKREEARQATEKAVTEILKPDQLKRVKQISLQQQGGRALSNPEIAAALKLSNEQKDKIKSIQDETRTARGQRGQRGQRSEEERKKQQEARKAANEKLMEVLTSAQKTKWKELTGEPFTGEISRRQFGGRNRPNGDSKP